MQNLAHANHLNFPFCCLFVQEATYHLYDWYSDFVRAHQPFCMLHPAIPLNVSRPERTKVGGQGMERSAEPFSVATAIAINFFF